MLIHERRILNYEIVHRQSCRDCRLVGYHVEIKATVSVRGVLNKTCINDSSWSWISQVIALLLNKTSINLFID
jgi:hypothetical protein